MHEAVLLVIGSVRDRDLSGARFYMLDKQEMAKVVRMSHNDYAQLRQLLDEIGGVENLGDIGSYRTKEHWARALRSTRGRIGTVVMDLKAYHTERNTKSVFGDAPVMMAHGGRCGLLPAYA